MIQHLSIRVPWHDSGWNGTVCRYPQYNQACRVLKTIAEKKNDEHECNCSGQSFCALGEDMPPCLYSNGAFMCDESIEGSRRNHPYTYDERFKHIEPTPLSIEPYSFVATPYSWTLREKAEERVASMLNYTQYDKDIEPVVGSNNWVSNGRNQEKIFNYFYKNVSPDVSMTVAYAKAVPFIETPGRIVIGIGMITSIGGLQQYKYNRELNDNDIRSYLWERQIGHSIRESHENGFLFPFDEIQKYLRNNPDQLPEELVVIAPDGYFEEFSYACEHLSHDALILTLNKTIAVLRRYRELKIIASDGGDWSDCITWCKNRLEAVWCERGLYPGLGNMIQAAGLKYGKDIADKIRETVGDAELWDKMGDIINKIGDYLPDFMNAADKRSISKAKLLVKYKTNPQRLKLLAAINLTLPQAVVALEPLITLKSKNDTPHYADFLSDFKKQKKDDVTNNPYLLYEQTRLFEDKYRFSIEQIDVAMFPHPCLNADSIVGSYDDERRLRAIFVSLLENTAERGSTLMTASDMAVRANSFCTSDSDDIQLEVDEEFMSAFEDVFADEFRKTDARNADGEELTAYKLNRLSNIDEVIKSFIVERLDGEITVKDDWAVHLKSVIDNAGNNELRQEAQNQQINAIKTMAASKISVLTGGAGTGKTTALAALCMSLEIQKNDIVILAPTGKARVVLSAKLSKKDVKHTPYTVYQFLRKTYHCDWNTKRYYLSDEQNPEVSGATVIIDECSMLTEEMMGAVLEAAKHAKRVILVGDPNQLPPIGAGKPFFEIAEYIAQNHSSRYAKLTISNRQHGDTRLDSQLAKLFTFDQSKEVPDDIFSQVAVSDTNIEFMKFDGDDDLHGKLLDVIAKAADMENADDIHGFDVSLGGTVNDGYMNFGGDRISHIDRWQIISPYRNDPISGSRVLNRLIQEKYRIKAYKGAAQKRKTEYPLGSDGILYGEKVINIQNQRVYIPALEEKGDVANGEIGIVEGFFKDGYYHRIRFTSQPETAYSYRSKITDNDSDSLELAYALTVHKSQGSGFDITVLVINEPPNGANYFITRELIYTALTRQSEKIYILYNKEPSELKKYSYAHCSDLAQRLTDLFGVAIVSKYKNRFYVENLIHTTKSGELVRSKSEAIIYNELLGANVKFKYEEGITVNGKPFSPDFTVYLPNDKVIYWEHLGMLSNAKYAKDWKRKKSEYEKGGISVETGNLIITEDKPNRAIDTRNIAEIVSKLNE
jgi:hypothetical protein